MRIKICGITNVEDGQLAARLGADAIGLNFYSRSKRYIDKETARRILCRLPPFVEPVGLFVNRPLVDVCSVAEDLGLVRSVQIHGDKLEPIPEEPFRFIPAFPVRDSESLEEIRQYLDSCRQKGPLPAALLVDAHVPGEYGGTGQTAPWQVLAEFQSEFPVILAGGLTPDNVAEAIRNVRPYAVDVASGVEKRPGEKDRDKMKRFIDQAREAAVKLGI